MIYETSDPATQKLGIYTMNPKFNAGTHDQYIQIGLAQYMSVQ